MSGMDAPTEADSPRDGFLSYAGEWHALTIGLAAGFSAGVLGQPEIAGAVAAAAIGFDVLARAKGKLSQGKRVLAEIRREPWYAVGGDALGYVAAALLTGQSILTGVL